MEDTRIHGSGGSGLADPAPSSFHDGVRMGKYRFRDLFRRGKLKERKCLLCGEKFSTNCEHWFCRKCRTKFERLQQDCPGPNFQNAIYNIEPGDDDTL